jgi:hypothetical protein
MGAVAHQLRIGLIQHPQGGLNMYYGIGGTVVIVLLVLFLMGRL